jgi:hypothetical protein
MPSLASKVPETPTNRLFYGDIQNMVNRYKFSIIELIITLFWELFLHLKQSIPYL